MRRIMTVAAVLFCASGLLAAGCGNKQARSPSEQPLPPRDTSTLDSALLGQARNAMNLTEAEYPFIDTRQQP